MSQESEQPTKEKTKKRWNLKLWQKVIAGLVVAFVVLAIIVNSAASGAVKVSNEFLKDVQNKNSDAAYSLFTKGAAGTTTKDQFSGLVGQIGPILNSNTKMTSKEVKGQTGSAATSRITYEIKGTDGLTYVITINMQKEDGQWKVMNFESTKKQ